MIIVAANNDRQFRVFVQNNRPSFERMPTRLFDAHSIRGLHGPSTTIIRLPAWDEHLSHRDEEETKVEIMAREFKVLDVSEAVVLGDDPLVLP